VDGTGANADGTGVDKWRGPKRIWIGGRQEKKRKFWHKFSNFGTPKSLSSSFGIGFGLEL
jgi:hypothetical protein